MWKAGFESIVYQPEISAVAPFRTMKVIGLSPSIRTVAPGSISRSGPGPPAMEIVRGPNPVLAARITWVGFSTMNWPMVAEVGFITRKIPPPSKTRRSSAAGVVRTGFQFVGVPNSAVGAPIQWYSVAARAGDEVRPPRANRTHRRVGAGAWRDSDGRACMGKLLLEAVSDVNRNGHRRLERLGPTQGGSPGETKPAQDPNKKVADRHKGAAGHGETAECASRATAGGRPVHAP